jgi:hypothetical protein
MASREQNTKLVLPYDVPLRSCQVSFTDSRGIRHTAEVQADSLFEAAVLALGILKHDGWITETIGAATRLEVEVREPVTRHVVTLLQVQRWLNGATPSPSDRVKKDRLKALLPR